MHKLLKTFAFVGVAGMAMTLGARDSDARLSKAERARAVQLLMNGLQKYGVPTCVGKIIGVRESGGNPAAIGHDENWSGRKKVRARINFLKWGKRYSGSTFGSKRWSSSNRYNQYKNNDSHRANLSDYPDYGLDWRFSHGFGLGQITFGGADSKGRFWCRVYGERRKSSCYIAGKNRYGSFCRRNGKLIRGTWSKLTGCVTVPEMLTLDGGVKFGAARIAAWYRVASKKLTSLSQARAYLKGSCDRCYARARTDKSVRCADRSEVMAESLTQLRIRGMFAGYAGGYRASYCRYSSRPRRVRECQGSGGGTVKPVTPTTPTTPKTSGLPSSIKRLYAKFTSWVRSSYSKLLSFFGVGGMTGYVTAWVYLRSGPSYRSSRILTTRKCRDLKILGKQGKYIKVNYRGKTGWIHSKYVRPGSRKYCR